MIDLDNPLRAESDNYRTERDSLGELQIPAEA